MEVVKDKIGAIEFRMLSPELIKNMAAVKVITPELYDVDGYPVEGGLMDQKMGVISPGLRCRTCGGNLKSCNGHFGYIELARPVIHIKYADTIYNILRGTCDKCGRALLPDEEIEKAIDRLRKLKESRGFLTYLAYVKALSNKLKLKTKCPHCGAKQSKIKLIKPTTFMEGKTRLTPIDVRERLEKVPSKDAELFGIDPLSGRPEWMVLTLLPVPPVTARPSITLESGQRSEDDLTHKLGDIVRTNQRLWENLNAGAPEVIIEDLWELLQYHVTTFFTNSVSQIPPARHRSGRPLKTIEERIKSKEGRFRKNLVGKRVNYSARTVISPDPMIDIEEVGIPYKIAKELTVSIKVNKQNLKFLKKLVENGPNVYPGANYVVTPDGKRKRITDETKKVILEELSEGYIVERHLLDGDPVIFNRQPSLHRMSLMGHTAKILPGKTFRINLCDLVPYNADFDGDEMNLHVPQTEEAQAEVKHLMNIKLQLITPRYGLPILGLTKDHISGLYLLSKDDKVPSYIASRLLYKVGIKAEFKSKFVHGREIISKILPENLNYEGKNGLCKKCDKCDKEKCEYGGWVSIKNGKLISGYFDKSMVGSEVGTLLKEIAYQCGNEEAIKFLNRASRLGIAYLDYNGISVSLSDTDLPKEAVRSIADELDKVYKRINILIEKAKNNELELLPGRNLEETLEVKIMALLNKVRNVAGKIVAVSYTHLTLPTN